MRKHETDIVYCVPCGLLPQAERLKNDLKKNVFDIFVGGKLVFSRHKEKRFPETNEIIKMVE